MKNSSMKVMDCHFTLGEVSDIIRYLQEAVHDEDLNLTVNADSILGCMLGIIYTTPISDGKWQK